MDMNEIWEKMFAVFCEEMHTDLESWSKIHSDDYGASWQNRATGHVFTARLG